MRHSQLERVGAAALLFFIAGCSQPVLEIPLWDRVTTAAQEMRWGKQSDRQISVPIRFPAPVLVLALPAGTYTADKIDSLLPTLDARANVSQWSRGHELAPHRPAIYILPKAGGEVVFFQDYDHVFVPSPMAVWKAKDGVLDVALHRENDRVDIVALR